MTTMISATNAPAMEMNFMSMRTVSWICVRRIKNGDRNTLFRDRRICRSDRVSNRINRVDEEGG